MMKYPEANSLSILGHKTCVLSRNLAIRSERKEELGLKRLIHKFIMHMSLVSCLEHVVPWKEGLLLRVRSKITLLSAHADRFASSETVVMNIPRCSHFQLSASIVLSCISNFDLELWNRRRRSGDEMK